MRGLALLAILSSSLSAFDVREGLESLARLGSVLMIGAHPDDENTALLAYFARGRHFRTGYLSLTRGEGGQNRIGSEQGRDIGLIRSQELQAARRIDGAEQYFTHVTDFGYSKTAAEAMRVWQREPTLAAIVARIRRFQPDVVVLCFSGTATDGHGQHQVSSLLGAEAFHAAADANRFPESAPVWKARRLYWAASSCNRADEDTATKGGQYLAVDPGDYDPALGASYAEIAARSRSQHRSQAFGEAGPKGSAKAYLVHRAGDAASADPFDGIDTTWNRLPGGKPVGDAIDRARASFRSAEPWKIVPALVEARRHLAAIRHPWAAFKLNQLDEVIAQAAGIWADLAANRPVTVAGSNLLLTASAIRRTPLPVELVAVDGVPGLAATAALPLNRLFSAKGQVVAPLFLPETGFERRSGLPDPPPLAEATFRFRLEGATIALKRPAIYRWTDPVLGERWQLAGNAPPAAVRFPEPALLFPSAAARTATVEVRAIAAPVRGSVSLHPPAGWRVDPDSRPFTLDAEGDTTLAAFTLTPSETASTGDLRATATIGGQRLTHSLRVIDYEHIPPQVAFSSARTRLIRADTVLLSKRIGYIMGPGDEVPDALRQMGAEVSLLNDLSADLSRYDAIVTGVRAFNTRADLRAHKPRLFDYVAQGGTLVVQYNVLERNSHGGDSRRVDTIGPFPFALSSDRVSVEDAELRPIAPDHPLLQAPNRITPADYQGWVQERGLYFAGKWDPRYQPVWESNDPGEKPTQGATLYARHGKGVYIFTALSWFRQLPAGVPGGYRIFANMLSAGKAAR